MVNMNETEKGGCVFSVDANTAVHTCSWQGIHGYYLRSASVLGPVVLDE